MMTLIWYGLISGLLSLAGGLLIVWRSGAAIKIITPLVAFAAGAFLGVSFFDILPEALEGVTETRPIFIWLAGGFFAFFALERFIMRYWHQHKLNGESHSDHTESLPALVILGDSLHNFLDGVVIALSFVVNPALGLTTMLAVVAHEVPQEIGDFIVLLDRGWTKRKIIFVNIASSLLAVVGVVVGYYAAQQFVGWLPYLLAAVAGIFIYIAASDLIPEIHHRAGHKHIYPILLAFLLGLVSIGYLVSLAH